VRIDEEDYLKHWGVLGMHWGKTTGGDNSSGSSNKPRTPRQNSEKSLLDVRRIYEHQGSGKDPSKMTQKEIDSEITSISSRPVTWKISRNIQKENERLVKQQVKAYNNAADYANKVLIPNINKKYGKYNWTKLDTSDPRNPKGDPKLVKSYKRYIKEYETSFKRIYDKKLSELDR
jgi:hypothetical protein